VVTVSAGVCEIAPSGSNASADLVSKADALLYDAKRAGRNRVAVS
jgi:PleD family two-component response regulator